MNDDFEIVLNFSKNNIKNNGYEKIVKVQLKITIFFDVKWLSFLKQKTQYCQNKVEKHWKIANVINFFIIELFPNVNVKKFSSR